MINGPLLFLLSSNMHKVVSTILYGGDVNNDGATGNDLIYIPTTAEISTMIFLVRTRGCI
jgi:hypothetical protein